MSRTRKTQMQVKEELVNYIQGTSGVDQIRFDPASHSWTRGGESVSTASLARRLGVQHDLSDRRALNCLGVIAEDKFLEAQQALRQWVEGMEAQPECEVVTRQFLSLIQRPDTDDLTAECHLWALKQWVWQVKRHILRREVNYHVMPIFWSEEHGTGKSQAVRRLYAPIKHFARSMNVTDLAEKFSKKLLTQTLVAFFDELAGAEGVDKAEFKGFTTGRAFEGRGMYTEDGFRGVNRISCIATSNMRPPHGLEDPGGARRLWSIHCTGVAKSEDAAARKAMDDLDWPGIWRLASAEHDSIEHMIPQAIRKRMSDVRHNRLRAPDSFEAFWKERTEPAEDDERVRLSEVQKAYGLYCRDTGLRRVKMSQGRMLERLDAMGVANANGNNRPTAKGIRLLTPEADVQ